jgi:hypothetical protein
MNRYRVWMHTKAAMCRTFYDGKVDVTADCPSAAVEEAIRRAARVHGHRDFVVKNIELRK